MSTNRIELRLPDFDLGQTPVIACSWHAASGKRVVEGDRLLEVAAGDVSIDLAAPASGILLDRFVRAGDLLTIGQLLATIETS